MIIYGETIQGKETSIPKEVMTWLADRSTRYPNIDFKVNCYEPHPSQAEELRSSALKYSIIYSFYSPQGGVGQVIFPYASESWNVRIIGGLDKKGEIARSDDPNYLENFGSGLPIALRDEIAALPDLSKLERLSDKVVALPRL